MNMAIISPSEGLMREEEFDISSPLLKKSSPKTAVAKSSLSETDGSRDAMEGFDLKSFNSPISNKVTSYEDIKQYWEGVVVEYHDGEITARLVDKTNPENPDEFMTLSIEEIDDSDLPLVEPGALFTWYIGYRQGFRQPKERFSKIRFKRLPNWTEDELKRSAKVAQEYTDYFLAE